MLRLPTGSEPGEYEVQILDSQLAPKTSGTEHAEFQNQVTTLEGMLDLTAIKRSDYQLAIRHNGQPWQMFPTQAP